jgi:hypothetical protein
VLEALTAGIGILTWPMASDEFVNVKLLVESIGVAVPVWEGSNEVPQEEELVKVLKETVASKGTEVRNLAKEMGRTAAEAVREGR